MRQVPVGAGRGGISDAIEEEYLYVHCNVVKAGRVSLPEYWEGPCSWRMEYGETETVQRPEGFFRDSMPEEERLTLARPEALSPELNDDEARAKLRAKAKERSHGFAEGIRADGGGFMGMNRVRKQPRESYPNTRAPRRGIRPTVAGENKWARIEALRVNKSFFEEHGDCDGRPVPSTHA